MENVWNAAPSSDKSGGCCTTLAKVDGAGVGGKTGLMGELVRKQNPEDL